MDNLSPELQFDRELSLLAFHSRVLEQAKDESTPLLERLRFVCISTTNLDEFFEVRVAGLMQQRALGLSEGHSGLLQASHILEEISHRAHQLVDEQYRVLNEILIPELAANKIRFVRRTQWNAKQAAWIKRYFKGRLLPVISPLGLDPAHPFPRIQNKSLNFIVSLDGKDAFGRNSGTAIVQAPRSLPRIIPLPKEYARGPHDFVFLSSIIHAHVGDLFPGMTSTGCHQFRVTRNSELFVDPEEVDDLLRALQGQLPSRRFADAVRLEVADNCTADMAGFLLEQFNLEQNDLFQVNGPVNLKRMLAVYDLVDRPELKYPAWSQGIPRRLSHGDVFESIRRNDILLHHPYESFSPVVGLIQQAAKDPQVLAIKQTMYRTGHESALTQALMDAAKVGKEVTVVVELRARFDEAANIAVATQLQDVGVHVVYGVVGYKTHAKMLMVVRREGRILRRYIHLGTGNYHAGTSKIYTDFGLMTCDKDIGEDVHKVFQQLTGLGRASRLKKLLQAPFTLHKKSLELIACEADLARQGKPARIIAKMNSLTEPGIIAALYEASQAGVKIDLIVRGVCSLRPGVDGISDNIQVRSIVGRFLEHMRVVYFQNDGDSIIYCGSADWMERNLFSRVEVCFPIEDPRLQERVLKEGLMPSLSDNLQAWQLQHDGSYRKTKLGSAKPRSAQQSLLAKLGNNV
ncbi:MAG TPA: polyphosphate kinase 1 [Chromatiaceae bacterium]|nr:polyphosphate kinase 1 [Chromatiaceae bacterium]HIN82877.1 polyphosphate kinase 1 [Chromatiales bacterium]HIA09431.1 polyphosphate kinase 1 [Chromatiaceae bacterium]HIB83612.1 polyphosphate kinase 1 [Chromatiaceae bacterium]HIO13618.1 polyphosphate kinase 1 [Chromatiales bacterium]